MEAEERSMVPSAGVEPGNGGDAGNGDTEAGVTSRAMTRREAVEMLSTRIGTSRPSKQDLDVVRRVLGEFPALARLVEDLAYQAREQVVRSMSEHAALRDVVREAADKVQEGLEYSGAPALERLLIEQVGICWLRMYQTELRYTAARSEGGMSLEQAAWLEKRLTMVQHRYLKALETLARVRRLGRVTPLQVNIGAQQVNVAGERG